MRQLLVSRGLVRLYFLWCFVPMLIIPLVFFHAQSLDPSKRIGCEEMGGYDPLKQHPFFDTISWSDLHLQMPPKLTPYLPAMSEDDEDCYGNVRCAVTYHPSKPDRHPNSLFPNAVRRPPEPVQQHAGGPVQFVSVSVTTRVHASSEVEQQHRAVHPRPG